VRLATRFIATAIGLLAAVIGARALWLLETLWSSPKNFLPPPRESVGCPICPSQTLFTGETEQILIILGSLTAIMVAFLMWRSAAPRGHRP
jgi:hypothetical protein